MKKIIFGISLNLVTFSICFGVLKILQNAFEMIYISICLSKENISISPFIFSICLIIFIIPCAIALIVGALQNKRYLILIWLICSIMDLLSILKNVNLHMSPYDIVYRIAEAIVDVLGFYIITNYFIILRDSKRTRHTVESWTAGDEHIESEGVDVMT